MVGSARSTAAGWHEATRHADPSHLRDTAAGLTADGSICTLIVIYCQHNPPPALDGGVPSHALSLHVLLHQLLVWQVRRWHVCVVGQTRMYQRRARYCSTAPMLLEPGGAAGVLTWYSGRRVLSYIQVPACLWLQAICAGWGCLLLPRPLLRLGVHGPSKQLSGDPRFSCLQSL